jgi:hypothetical protein
MFLYSLYILFLALVTVIVVKDILKDDMSKPSEKKEEKFIIPYETRKKISKVKEESKQVLQNTRLYSVNHDNENFTVVLFENS